MMRKKTCIDCGGKRDLKRSDRSNLFRTRCRICWNKYCRIVAQNHKEYFAAYLKKYLPKWKKNNPESYRAVNNRSNKKAIAELKDSYVKNRFFKGKKSTEISKEMLDIQRMLLSLKRVVKNERN